MSKFTLTAAQQTASEHRGCAVLVSAAAGSGKTRVLTERLMRYVFDPESPRDIDKFLVITYTRAAAAELRGRILEELSARSAAEPQNRAARRQTSLCYCAPIATIHSFCTGVIRENSHALGLGADFRVGDEDRCALIKTRCLEKILDEAYEKMDELPGFAALSDGVGSGSDDSRLASTVLQLHGQLLSHPYPEKWAREQISRLERGDCGQYAEELLAQARQTAQYWYACLNDEWQGLFADEEANEPLINAYGESMDATLTELASLCRALDAGWDETVSALPVEFSRLGSVRNFPDEETKSRLLAVRAGCKKAMDKLTDVFDQTLESHRRLLLTTAAPMTALLRLTLRFDELYRAEKLRAGLLDFSDLEHYAVELLWDDTRGCPTALAGDISLRYEEIMVDEYQDVSAVQELILQSVSKGGSNLFMVGDVKQSVYRFRLADPTIFLRKYDSFTPPESESPGGKKILLQNNFRSDRAILDGCNSVFEKLMSRSLGEIDYNDDCALIAPETAPEAAGEVKMTLLALPGAEDGEERPDKTALEAAYVAQQIKALVSSGQTITDGGETRPLRYGDFAVLLHSPRSVGAIYAKALSDAGVPCASERSGGFFDSPEIVTMTAFLQVVDNPRRDVPLAACLASPMFGFTADELAAVRSKGRHCDFYTALCLRAEESEKCKRFLDFLNDIRSLYSDIPVRRLINLVCERLDLAALWTGAGHEACARLMLLSDMAAQFESSGYRGLRSFLDSLDSMRERSQEPALPTGGQDSVAIMSIHKSKGLEFPVVFLCDASRRFNMPELNGAVVMHPQLGVGCRVNDAGRGIEFPSLAHRAIRQRLANESLSEEMRVLYVAMTRAKQRLYITATVSDPEKLVSDLSTGLKSPIAPELLRGSAGFCKWLVMACIADGGHSLSLETVYPQTRKPEPSSPSEVCVEAVEPEELDALRKALSYSYPFSACAGLPAKLTATMLPDGEKDADSADILPPRPRIFRKIDLGGAERPLTAAERGTATHLVMQFIDFAKTGSEQDIRSEIERIAALGQLSPAQARAVDVTAISRFFASDLGGRIARADKVYREFRFSVFCPAEQYFPGAGDEKLLLQGVVDCCIEEAGALTIIDYKTDLVTEKTLDAVAAHYKKQLSAYASAMERITKKPVNSCILCFLSKGLFSEFQPLDRAE